MLCQSLCQPTFLLCVGNTLLEAQGGRVCVAGGVAGQDTHHAPRVTLRTLLGKVLAAVHDLRESPEGRDTHITADR